MRHAVHPSCLKRAPSAASRHNTSPVKSLTWLRNVAAGRESLLSGEARRQARTKLQPQLRLVVVAGQCARADEDLSR